MFASHRAMRRKLRVAAVDQSSRVAPPHPVVKNLSLAVDNCDPRFAAGAVKADSRAQRARSEAERLDGDNASLTMESDGSPNRTDFQRECCPRTTLRIAPERGAEVHRLLYGLGAIDLIFGAQTAWRERPRSLAAGMIGHPVRSRGRSRHGTCFERAAEHVCRTQAAKSAALADHRQLATPVEVVKAMCDVSSQAQRPRVCQIKAK